MSHTASEVFTMQLARGAGKQANKFLHARGLQKADRDDVISAALLWCWENRDNYSLTTTLETWFMNAVRDAYKHLQRNELPQATESVEELGGEDTTYNTVAAESSADALLRALVPIDRKIALLMMEGFTYAELVGRGYSNQAISNVRQRLKQLRKLAPERADEKFRTRAAPTASSDDADDTLCAIDLEIQALDFAPPAGKDCPPCFRCMWFEGFMPDGKRSVRMDIEDKDVREAVKDTEARKIEIAQQVRDGLFADH